MLNPFAQSACYYQVAFDLPQAAAEDIEHRFDDVAIAASAFEVDEENAIWHCELLFATPPDMAEIHRRVLLLATLAGAKMPELATATLEQQDWLSLVARNFPPLRIDRFYVYGSHVTDRPPISSIPIQVEAGAAFGSGEHGTTRGCLHALSWIHKRHRYVDRILDMGTGSGILAIGAAKLWNAEILAVDIDEVAVRVTKENVAINHETSTIRSAVSDGYKSKIVKEFGACDVIIANILARPLMMFANELARQLKPGGYAVLSGLLNDQATMVMTAHRQQGLHLVKEIKDEGWSTLILQK